MKPSPSRPAKQTILKADMTVTHPSRQKSTIKLKNTGKTPVNQIFVAAKHAFSPSARDWTVKKFSNKGYLIKASKGLAAGKSLDIGVKWADRSTFSGRYSAKLSSDKSPSATGPFFVSLYNSKDYKFSGRLVYLSAATWNVNTVWRDQMQADTASNVFFRSMSKSGSLAAWKQISQASAGVPLDSGPKMPQAASDINIVYVVWVERDAGTGKAEVFMSASADWGATFSVPKKLSDGRGDARVPRIVASGGYAYAAWESYDGTNTSVLFRKISHSGATLGTIIPIATNGRTPDLAMYGQTVLAVYDIVASKICMRKSTDGGATFGAPVDVAIAGSGASAYFDPRFAVVRNRIFVITRGSTNKDDIYSVRITSPGPSASGDLVEAPVNVSMNSTQSRPVNIATFDVAVSDTSVFVVWTNKVLLSSNQISEEVRFARCLASASFTAAMLIGSASASEPVLAAYGSNVHIIWGHSTTTANNEIYVRSSTDDGSSFGAEKPLSDPNLHSVAQKAAARGPNLYVAWTPRAQNTDDVLMTRSADRGATFKSPVNISADPPADAGIRAEDAFVWVGATLTRAFVWIEDALPKVL
ncbi:hypothetical protein [Candidatus Nitrososphaera sp. FF02]|uniref:hypothetical protein n=1 Tax=Candidatus Nitrososphaera sp. FF02 TaxID=3398226 RepID=UPI0039EA45E2